MTPETRKRLIALGQRHMMLAEKAVIPDDTAAADADRSYVQRAAEQRDYHLAVAAALRAFLTREHETRDNAAA